MNHIAAISRLARVADCLAAEQLPAPDDCAAHADALRQYLGRECKSTDEAMGVARGPGIGDARDALARHKRDEWFRKAAATHKKTAKELATIEHSYISQGAWKRDQTQSTCPTRLQGTVQGCIWHALKAWPREIGERQIEIILPKSTP